MRNVLIILEESIQFEYEHNSFSWSSLDTLKCETEGYLCVFTRNQYVSVILEVIFPMTDSSSKNYSKLSGNILLL